MPTRNILVLNSGSSSIKFSIYQTTETERTKLFEGAGYEREAGGEVGDGGGFVDELGGIAGLAVSFREP